MKQKSEAQYSKTYRMQKKAICLEQQMPTLRKIKNLYKQPNLTPRGTRKKRKKNKLSPQGSRNKGPKRTLVQRQKASYQVKPKKNRFISKFYQTFKEKLEPTVLIHFQKNQRQINMSNLVLQGQSYPVIKTRQGHYKNSIDQYLS